MAAGAWVMYDTGKLDLFDEDFVTDDHHWQLALTGYTPATTHSTWNDVVASVCADGDYVAQNATTESTANASGTITVDIGDVDFGNTVTITAKYLILVQGTVAAVTTASRLVGYCDLDTGGGSPASTAGNYDITINASGIVTAT